MFQFNIKSLFINFKKNTPLISYSNTKYLSDLAHRGGDTSNFNSCRSIEP